MLSLLFNGQTNKFHVRFLPTNDVMLLSDILVNYRRPAVLTIYMGKPEIPVGKSNGSRHSIWETSENMGCDLR